MAINNKRVKLEKTQVKTKLKENQDKPLFEDDDLEMGDLEDENTDDEINFDSEGEDEDEDGFENDDFSSEDEFSSEEEADEFDNLTPPQQEIFDDEVDELLSANLEHDDFDSEELSEAEDLDLEDDEFSSEDDDFESEEGEDDFEGEDDDYVTDLLTSRELENIIDSPDSFHSLENELVTKIENEDSNDFEDDEDFNFDDEDTEAFPVEDEDEELIEEVLEMDENEEMDESVALGNLKELDFENESPSKLEKRPGSVSNTGKGAQQKTGGSLKKMQQESIRKSKMLVEAATEIKKTKIAAIKKSKALNEASKAILLQKNQISKLRFENAKLLRVNGILAAVGGKLTKEVSKQIVESFAKCTNDKQVKTLYEKVVRAIKAKLKPSLNESVNKVKTNVKTSKTVLKENKSGKTIDREQQRKDMLMGLATSNDAYYFS